MMQVHFRNTKKAKAFREYLYGERKDIKPIAPKKTRLDVLKERRKKWETIRGEENEKDADNRRS